MSEISPAIGKWYRRENGDLFEVVAYDEQERVIEIQYFDGTVEELDSDEWEQIELEEAEAPEDWTGSVDVDEKDVEEAGTEKGEEFDDPLEYFDSKE